MFKLSLIPREKKFFVLFEQSALNSLRMAQQLRDMISIWENVKERVEVITDLEHQGDAIAHLIIAQLDRSFITPLDREDIAELTHSLDDIADFIHASADTMLIYKVERPTERAKEMADITVQIVTEVTRAISEMQQRIDQKKLLRQCVEINRLEDMADRVYRSTLGELFTDSTDIAYIIKWREIYGHMERAIDSCEDVANVLEGVALKYT